MSAPVDAVAGLTGPDGSPAHTPALSRRLSAFVYEGVLLFGVLMIGGLISLALEKLLPNLAGPWFKGLSFFLLLAAYFVGFWTNGGQTLAMKSWHIRLVDVHGRPVGKGTALMRFLLCWLWFTPALLLTKVVISRADSLDLLYPVLSVSLSAGVVAYALLTRLHPQRQFWHDAVCGTRLVTWRHPPRQRPSKA